MEKHERRLVCNRQLFQYACKPNADKVKLYQWQTTTLLDQYVTSKIKAKDGINRTCP